MTDSKVVKERIQLVRGLSNNLAAFFQTLPDDVWRNAEQFGSACENWKLADVIGHLVLDGISLALSITRARTGNLGPPMGYHADTEEENVLAAISFRDVVYDELFAEFNATSRRLNMLFLDMGDGHYDDDVWQPMGVVPSHQLVDRRLRELAVHGWDIRYGLDRSAELGDEVLPFLKSQLNDWLRCRLDQHGAHETSSVYRFALDGDDGDSYDILLNGKGVDIEPAGDRKPDVTFRCDANTYVLFLMGRLPFSRAVRRGRISFEGDEILARQFSSIFQLR